MNVYCLGIFWKSYVAHTVGGKWNAINLIDAAEKQDAELLTWSVRFSGCLVTEVVECVA